MFQVDDPVLVKKLKRKGVVREIAKNGRYKVAIGNLLVQVAEAELEAVTETVKKKSLTQKTKKPSFSSLKHKVDLPLCLDLHGLSSTEAIAKVESYIEQAIRADLSEVQIMHGIGTGKLRDTIHDYLRKLKVVSAFKLEERNPGVTRVFL